MTSLGRNVLCWAAASLAILTPAVSAVAQSPKPAVVVSITKPDKLLADIGYLTRAAGTPEFGGLVTIMAGPYLQGVDTKRPIGAYLQFNGPQPTGVAFLPVTNIQPLLQQLENNSIEVEDAGDGVKKIQLQRAIYFVEKGGWVFISDSETNLKNVPADPTASLGGLNEQYDLAVRVNVRNIDPNLIDMAVSEMKAGFERTLEAEDDPEKRELQEKVGRQQLESFARLIEESDQITLGWGVDSQGGKTFIDVGMTAVAGTKLAEQMASYKQLTSNFAGLDLEDAAASMRITAPIAKEDIARATETLKALGQQAEKAIDEDDDLPNDEARAAAKEVVSSFIEILIATVQGGKFDGGVALLLEDETLQVVGGGLVADGNKVQAQLKKLVKLAKEAAEGDDVPEVTFNASKHKGVDFHTFSVPIPDEDDARKVLGEELDVVVGTAAKAALFAAGEGAEDLLKEVIDASAAAGKKEVLPFELKVALTPILEFAASLENDPIVKRLAETSKNSNGKDHVTVTQRSVDRGVTARLEIEEGVLQLIGAAAKARNNSGN